MADGKEFLVRRDLNFEAGFYAWEAAALENLAKQGTGAGTEKLHWSVLTIFLVRGRSGSQLA